MHLFVFKVCKAPLCYLFANFPNGIYCPHGKKSVVFFGKGEQQEEEIFFIQISTRKNKSILFSYSYVVFGTSRNLGINLSKFF